MVNFRKSSGSELILNHPRPQIPNFGTEVDIGTTTVTHCIAISRDHLQHVSDYGENHMCCRRQAQTHMFRAAQLYCISMSTSRRRRPWRLAMKQCKWHVPHAGIGVHSQTPRSTRRNRGESRPSTNTNDPSGGN